MERLGNEVLFSEWKWSGSIDLFQQILRILFRKERCQIAAEDHRGVDDQIQVFHGKCQVV